VSGGICNERPMDSMEYYDIRQNKWAVNIGEGLAQGYASE
jgi:hypothetical protein